MGFAIGCTSGVPDFIGAHKVNIGRSFLQRSILQLCWGLINLAVSVPRVYGSGEECFESPLTST